LWGGIALVLLLGLVVFLTRRQWANIDWPLVLATCLGAGVGVGELISRYRDDPLRAVWTRPAAMYVAINALAAFVALKLVILLNIRFGIAATAPADQVEWVRALGAGLSAMALFRSALFVVRAGDKDVGIGPVSFLQVVLDASDRAVDRLRAESRATFVAELMKDVSFARAQEALPTLCLALMQNLPKEDQERLGRSVGDLAKAKIDDRIKGTVLGLSLLNAVGEEVLEAAVTALGSKLHFVDRITLTPPTLALQVGQAAGITAKVFDPHGTEITDCDCVWTTGNSAIAQVTASGVVTAASAGITQVVAALDKGQGIVQVTVT
jgi:Big-like domain-containing protein